MQLGYVSFDVHFHGRACRRVCCALDTATKSSMMAEGSTTESFAIATGYNRNQYSYEGKGPQVIMSRTAEI